MQGIKLPASKVQAVAALQQQAAKKFSALIQTVKLDGVKFDGVEGATPSCDTTNGDTEIIKYAPRRPLHEQGQAWLDSHR